MLSLRGSGKSCSISIQFTPSTKPALLLSVLSLSLVLFATSLLSRALGASSLTCILGEGTAGPHAELSCSCLSCLGGLLYGGPQGLALAQANGSLHPGSASPHRPQASTSACGTVPRLPPPSSPALAKEPPAAPVPGFPLLGWQPLEWSAHSSAQHFPQVPLDWIVSAPAQHFSGQLSAPHTTLSQPLGQTSEYQSHIALRAS